MTDAMGPRRESRNEFGQPIGWSVDWRPTEILAPPVTLIGRTCRLEPLEEKHDQGLYDSLCTKSPASIWTYMSNGPFAGPTDFAEYLTWLRSAAGLIPLAILDPGNDPVGIAAYSHIDHRNGIVEAAAITYSAALQRTTGATEAMYLMASHAFEVVRVRRYEWKCDALNWPSREAALRLGFSYEGVFRQDMVRKGRNRDTAWFSIVDDEWIDLRRGYESWLDPDNFDASGAQRRRLHDSSRSDRTSAT